MHGSNAFVITSDEFIGAEDIFGVIVTDFQQTVILPVFRFFGSDTLRDLYVYFFALACSHKINLAVICFTDVYSVSATAQFQIYDVFQSGGNGI